MKRFVYRSLLALVCANTAIPYASAKNVAPVAQSMSLSVGANFANPIVLKASDANGDPLTFSIVSPPTHGTLAGTSPNLTYIPSPNYVGPDRFAFVANDGRLSSGPAAVSLTVKPGILVNNISITEGNTGDFGFATFFIMATAAVNSASFVITTVDGTATQALDYLPTSLPITSFSKSAGDGIVFVVRTVGDTVVEPNETFLLQLFNPSPNIVLLNGGVGRCTIVDDDLNIVCCLVIGSAALAPEHAVVAVGERIDLSLDWTHPVGWQQLESVDLVLSDNGGTALRARWHGAANAFSLLNASADKFLRIDEAGSPARLETPVVTVHLADSTGGGPPGQTATIDFSLSFKPRAAGRTFSVEAFATDDAGNQQGFESVGTISVLAHPRDQ